MKNITKALLAASLCSAFVLSANTANALTLRFGFEPPRNDSQYFAAEEFKRIVEEKTNGDIEIKLFPDSTLGDPAGLMNGIRNGTVDITVIGSSYFAGLSPELNVLDIPFLFPSREDAFKVLDGPTGKYLLGTLEKVNIKGLAFWDNGFRAMSNNIHPITKPEDVKGIKMRVPGYPMSVKLFEVLGANPVPMALGELYTALETHTVDGQDHPIGIFYSSKLYEVQKYLSISNHQYTALLVGMTKSTFDKLSPEYQQIILDAALAGANFQRKMNSDQAAAQIAEFKKHGVEVIEQIDQKPFKDAAFDEVAKFYIDQYGDKLVKEISAQVAE